MSSELANTVIPCSRFLNKATKILRKIYIFNYIIFKTLPEDDTIVSCIEFYFSKLAHFMNERLRM